MVLNLLTVKNKVQKMKILIISIVIMTLVGCEGFKTLTLHNVSDTDARIIVKPGIDEHELKNTTNYQKTPDKEMFILKPDSSVNLLTTFTILLFNSKIKERDLHLNYLKIETKTDTITANSKKEIISLIRNGNTKYKRKLDKGYIDSNGRNLKNIFIRN